MRLYQLAAATGNTAGINNIAYCYLVRLDLTSIVLQSALLEWILDGPPDELCC